MKVLVTGVGRYLGAHVAARLADDPAVTEVIGVDIAAPPDALSALLSSVKVVIGDLREIVESVTQGGVETVVHMGVLTDSPPRGGRSAPCPGCAP